MEFLKGIRYPGRFIVMGADGDAVVTLYGLTGRSAPSQARKFVRKGSAILTVPTDESVIAEGNRELLEYPAFKFFGNGLAVANARHIARVRSPGADPKETLIEALKQELPEPDRYCTPRITGCVAGESIALHSVRGTTESPTRTAWDVPASGGAKYIATYNGDESNPKQFAGDPLEVILKYGSAPKAARTLYDLMAPPSGAPDYRVGVVAVYQKPGEKPDVAIINRADLVS